MLGLSGEAAEVGGKDHPVGRESSKDPRIGSLRAICRSGECGAENRTSLSQVVCRCNWTGRGLGWAELRKESTLCSFEGRAGSGSPAARAPGTGVRPATGKARGTASSAPAAYKPVFQPECKIPKCIMTELF